MSSRKTFKWAVFAITFVIELELALRAASWGIQRYSDFLNAHGLSESVIPTVLVVSDCMSADSMYLADRPWPRLLEEEIRRRGKTIRVINESYPLATTARIASALPGYFEKYHPAVVVIMSGLVDRNLHWLKEIDIAKTDDEHGLASLKIVKVAQVLLNYGKFERQPTFSPSQNKSFDPRETREAFQAIFKVVLEAHSHLLAVQYPLTNVSELENYFTANQRAKISFVSNTENFEELLSSYTPKDLFFDFIGGNWGHCTSIANSAVANAVADGLMKILAENDKEKVLK